MSKSKPNHAPSESSETSLSGDAITDQSAPQLLSGEDIAMISNVDSAPTLEPPAFASEDTGMTVWVQDKRISALWSKSQNRNSWVNIVGIGWKKLANNSNTAVVALTMLASHGKHLNTRVNYREEADGMIYEMYVW